MHDTDRRDRHRDEVPKGHPCAAEPICKKAAEWAHHRTDQWSEKSDTDRDRRKLGLEQQWKRGRVADERAKGPAIEPGHHPSVCLRLTIMSWLPNVDRAEVRLFMNRCAPNTAIAISGSHISPAFGKYRPADPCGCAK